MSKLQELIKELCPDGVEFRKLGEISNFRRGSFPQPYGNKEWYGGEGAMPFIQVADIEDNMQLAKKTKRLISRLAQPMSVFAPKGSIIISLQGSIGRIAVTQYDAYIDRTVAIFTNISKNIIPKYFVYQLQSIFKIKEKTARGSTIKTITKEEFTNFEIPLPPLEVQKEIVRILDAFTAHTAELQAELQARKEQYEYYRNKLLTFDENDERVKWMTLGEVSVNVCSGGTPSTSNKKYYQGHIPWLRTQEVDWKDVFYTKIKISEDAIKNSSAKIIPPNCVIVAMYGATAGKTCINKIPLTTNQACCNLEINKDIALYKYVYYWLYKEYYKLKALGEGSQSNISGKKIKSYAIPIPPLSEQQRIISILDKFESLVNDLSEGLPAEIAAVQEQYEYYRNKLLTFKRKS